MLGKIFDKLWEDIASKKRITIYLIGVFLLINVVLLVTPIKIDIKAILIGETPFSFISNLSKLILVSSIILFEFAMIMTFIYFILQDISAKIYDFCNNNYWYNLKDIFSDKPIWFLSARLGSQSVAIESFRWLLVSALLLNIVDKIDYINIWNVVVSFFNNHIFICSIIIGLNFLSITYCVLNVISSLHYQFFHFSIKTN